MGKSGFRPSEGQGGGQRDSLEGCDILPVWLSIPQADQNLDKQQTLGAEAYVHQGKPMRAYGGRETLDVGAARPQQREGFPGSVQLIAAFQYASRALPGTSQGLDSGSCRVGWVIHPTLHQRWGCRSESSTTPHLHPRRSGVSVTSLQK